MPRYYFDIRDGDYVQKDNEGTVLGGLAVILCAAAAVRVRLTPAPAPSSELHPAALQPVKD